MRVSLALALTVTLLVHSMATPSWAIRITNVTTSTLLFSDDFESLGTSVSHAAWQDASGDYDPDNGAAPGFWAIGNGGTTGGGIFDDISNPESVESDIQVTDFAGGPDPGPFSGNYLRLDREDVNSSAYAVFDSAQSTSGDVIRTEMMFATSSANNSSVAFVYLTDTGGTANLPFWDDDGSIDNRVGGTVTSMPKDGGGFMQHSPGEWNRVIMDYTIGESTYDLTVINDAFGVQVSTGNDMFSGAVSGLSGIRGTASARTSDGGTRIGAMYFDETIDIIATVDRETAGSRGNITIESSNANPITILGYSLTSENGALDPSAWTSIAGNYDQDNGGPVDLNDNWTELTNSSSHGDLSEVEFEGGDGATLINGQTIDLGDAWIKNTTDTEDIVLTLLLDNGSTISAPVFFTGNSGAPFIRSDLDFDGDIDPDDWVIFVENLDANLSGLSRAEAYQKGDLVGNDSENNFDDFVAFESDYDSFNTPGSFAAMLASVPEPSSTLLILLGGLGLMALRR